MIKLLKKKKSFDLRTKIVNTLMTSGKKKTGEKILLKSMKNLQRSTTKNSKSVLQLAIINSTPTFKLNEQIVKKGKRKAVKITPSFIIKDSLRIMTSLKLIKTTASKNKSADKFDQIIAKELMASALLKSQSVNKKNELQKQVLMNKRYLSKFRW